MQVELSSACNRQKSLVFAVKICRFEKSNRPQIICFCYQQTKLIKKINNFLRLVKVVLMHILVVVFNSNHTRGYVHQIAAVPQDFVNYKAMVSSNLLQPQRFTVFVLPSLSVNPNIK